MTKKYVLIPVVAAVLFAATARPVEAFWPFDGWNKPGATTSPTAQSTFSPLIEKIISTFNLDRTKVAETVSGFQTENKAKRLTNRQDMLDARLSVAVKNGQLTEEKKTLILNKVKEVQTQRQADRAALMKWATDNGIDVKYLWSGRGGMMGAGTPFGARFSRGMMDRDLDD